MCRDLSRVPPLLTFNISMVSLLFSNKLQVFLANKISLVFLAALLSQGLYL